MNCKQGDLAIVVRSQAGNEGKVVRCLRSASVEEVLEAWLPWRPESTEGHWWLIDGLMRGSKSNKLRPYALDSVLIPLRGLPEDEDTPTETPLDIPEQVR